MIVTRHNGIHVVRDDMYPGGTKARYLMGLFRSSDTELVYASPVQGGAQIALAYCAKQTGKRVSIFCAKRQERHPRTIQAAALGATIHEIAPGYLSVVQSRARDYAANTGATLLPFGIDTDGSRDVIAGAALSSGITPDDVWCSSGSGTLSRGLQHAWPSSEHHVVQVGRDLTNIGRATIHRVLLKFEDRYKGTTPFPSDRHYDAKAWDVCLREHNPAKIVLFWNVLGE